jgi:hypothetical protein
MTSVHLVEEVTDAWSPSDGEWTASGTAAQVLSGEQVGNGSWRFGAWTLFAGSTMSVDGKQYSRELQIECASLEAIALGGLDGLNAGRGGLGAPLGATTLGLRLATPTSFVFGETRIVRVNADCYRIDLGTCSSASAGTPLPPPPPSTPTLSVLLKRRRAAGNVLEYSVQVHELMEHAEARVAVSRWFAPFAAETNADDAVAYHLTTRTAPNGYIRTDVVPVGSPTGYGALLGRALVWRVPLEHAMCGGRGGHMSAGFFLLFVALLAVAVYAAWAVWQQSKSGAPSFSAYMAANAAKSV